MTDGMRVLVVVLVVVAAMLLVGSIYLRRRARGVPESAVAGPQLAVAQAERETEPATPVEFRLVSAEGERPVLTATLLAHDAFGAASLQGRALDTRGGGVSRLVPILGAVRLGADAAGVGLIRLLQVVVDRGLAVGAGTLGLRAVMLDGDGVAIAPARLQDSGALRFPFSGALLSQMVTVLAAQQHLAAIQSQLEVVSQAIDGVSECLEAEQYREVHGVIDAMALRIGEIRAGFLDERFVPQWASHEQDLVRIQGNLRDRIHAAVARLGELTSGFWDAARKRQEHIEHSQLRFRRGVRGWQFVTEVRVLGWMLVVALPGSSALKSDRRRAIEDEIALLFADDGLVARFDRELRDQVARIQRLVRKAEAGRQRDSLGREQDALRSELQLQHAGLLGRIAAFGASTPPEAPYLHLAVKLEGEDIVEAFEWSGRTEQISAAPDMELPHHDAADTPAPLFETLAGPVALSDPGTAAAEADAPSDPLTALTSGAAGHAPECSTAETVASTRRD